MCSVIRGAPILLTTQGPWFVFWILYHRRVIYKRLQIYNFRKNVLLTSGLGRSVDHYLHNSVEHRLYHNDASIRYTTEYKEPRDKRERLSYVKYNVKERKKDNSLHPPWFHGSRPIFLYSSRVRTVKSLSILRSDYVKKGTVHLYLRNVRSTTSTFHLLWHRRVHWYISCRRVSEWN